MLTWVVALGSLSLASPAAAQSDATRAAARDLGADGVEAFQAGNYAVASEKLGRAFEILRVPSLGLWSARALVKVGKLVEASERYLTVSRLDPGTGDVTVQKQAQADAVTEREALQPRIPSLTIELKGGGPGAAVKLDGAALPAALLGVRQPANPGAHQAEAQEAGRAVSGQVTLAEGQRLTLTLDFAQATAAPGAGAAAETSPGAPATQASVQPPQPAADSAGPQRSSGLPAGFWVGVAVAGAGLATGSITAVLASQKKSDLNCEDDVCAQSLRNDVDAHNSLLTVSTIGFIAAGVGAATAGVFLLTRPKETQQGRSVTPWLGLGAAGVRGTF